MKKSKAIVILLLLVLLITGIGYMDIFGLDKNGKGSASDIKLGLDLAGGVSITYQVVGEEEPSKEDMDDTVYKLQQRVENYSNEAIVYQQGSDRICIEIPGVSDANKILEELGTPGALYFIAQNGNDGKENYQAQLVADDNGAYFYDYVLLRSIPEILADGSIVIQGTDVADAHGGAIQDQMGNQEYAVSLTLTDAGTKAFAEATRVAYAQGSTIGIYYDGRFVSVPRVSAVITNGSAQISGMSSYDEAVNLASTIRIGGLSLELEELQSKVVGASLGTNAISTSIKAGAIGLALVIVFMIAVYYFMGLAASIALVSYVAMIVMLLNGFALTLTLPGIAGIILSIGMAVDANVIVFARIREEIAAGFDVRDSIKTGFNKAFPAILDGNVTTLIAAVVLLWLAPGSIKGFAQTLALGICLSMFTALVVTRWILYSFYALGVKKPSMYGAAKNLKPIKIVENKAKFFILSAILIVAGFVAMGIYKGTGNDTLNYSLEFKGGTSTTVGFEKEYTLDELTSKIVPAIEEVAKSSVQVQTIQDTTEAVFKTNALDVEQRIELEEMFKEKFDIDASSIQSETISSTISGEMKKDTFIALGVAIIFMLIYIRIRFSDIRFGISSVVCLVHDVLVVLTFYAIARVSVGNTFVACMLTIVGYSINATIVVFDRVRETLAARGSRADLKEVINEAVTQTLTRSLYTSITTFIMVFVLYILGVTSIKEFALPLIVGIICGAYSSVCVAGSLWFVLRKKFPPKAED